MKLFFHHQKVPSMSLRGRLVNIRSSFTLFFVELMSTDPRTQLKSLPLSQVALKSWMSAVQRNCSNFPKSTGVDVLKKSANINSAFSTNAADSNSISNVWTLKFDKFGVKSRILSPS
ncbi:unnamed protein product [Taenia asiatica]|uniref:PH domain-containing protein n=1 Tax=Taenia asiatica TaxID=60517 RepID=A0A0R3W7I1_TAEAS|nr:unnamed protein product [Taenia asiatica]